MRQKKQGEELFVGSKINAIVDKDRYASKVDAACTEMLQLLDENEVKTINWRLNYLKKQLPTIAEKHNVKLSTLIKIFEI